MVGILRSIFDLKGVALIVVSSVLTAAFTEHLVVTASLSPLSGASVLVHREAHNSPSAPAAEVGSNQNNETTHGAPPAQELCHDALSVDRWIVWFGSRAATLNDAVSCYDPRQAGGSSCMRQVQSILEHHIADGASVLQHVTRSFNTVVELSNGVQAHGGVCEVVGEAYIPFVRLRMPDPHHSSSARDRLHRHQEAMRRAEEERRRLLMARGIRVDDLDEL